LTPINAARKERRRSSADADVCSAATLRRAQQRAGSSEARQVQRQCRGRQISASVLACRQDSAARQRCCSGNHALLRADAVAQMRERRRSARKRHRSCHAVVLMLLFLRAVMPRHADAKYAVCPARCQPIISPHGGRDTALSLCLSCAATAPVDYTADVRQLCPPCCDEKEHDTPLYGYTPAQNFFSLAPQQRQRASAPRLRRMSTLRLPYAGKHAIFTI